MNKCRGWVILLEPYSIPIKGECAWNMLMTISFNDAVKYKLGIASISHASLGFHILHEFRSVYDDFNLRSELCPEHFFRTG